MKNDDSSVDYYRMTGGRLHEWMPGLELNESRDTGVYSMVLTILMGAHSSLRPLITLQQTAVLVFVLSVWMGPTRANASGASEIR